MKKLFIAIGCLFLGLTIFELASSLAVFESNIQSENDLKIAKWHIYVNDYDLGVDSTFYVDNITYTNNGKVSDGKFAPGSKGEFILEINPKDTDVAIEYFLNIDLTDTYPQIKIDSIEGINGTVLTKENDTYSKIITLNDIQNGKTDMIKVTFSWTDSEEYNESDSQLGLDENSQIEIPISINFNQYIE